MKESETLNPAGSRVNTQNHALNFSPDIILTLFFPCIYLDAEWWKAEKARVLISSSGTEKESITPLFLGERNGGKWIRKEDGSLWL